ncbi:MAG: DUF1573 domain-containing protein [Nitrospira sp.]|nr:DUF1573 domain-containing protein [Nitrospira sp.]
MASSDHLKPKEKGKIIAKINIKGSSGYISKTIRVMSNDPKRPLVILILRGMIKNYGDQN